MSLLKYIIRTKYRSSFATCISSTDIHPKFQTPISFGRGVHLTQKFGQGSSKFTDDPKFKAFKAKQAKMQCDDGYPVHLKGGIMDKILYHVSVGVCLIGLAQCFWLFYILATTT